MGHVIRIKRRGGVGLAFALAAMLALAACGKPSEPEGRAPEGDLGRAYSALPHPDASPAKAPTPVPYIVIKFDRPGVTFADTLYTAMSRALDRYPAVRFDVVLAMPPLAPGANPDEALRLGEQHIEDVVLTMTDIGLPSDRLRIAASTDEAASVDEIRIFVR